MEPKTLERSRIGETGEPTERIRYTPDQKNPENVATGPRRRRPGVLFSKNAIQAMVGL